MLLEVHFKSSDMLELFVSEFVINILKSYFKMIIGTI